MTLLDRLLARGVPMPTDPVLATRVERHLRRIQPDPLFRQRLRSVVVNRYVAAREGLVPMPLRERRSTRQMGRLGRSVLYASVIMAIGTSAVGAASQESLPGDALYGVKLQLESIRMQIAPPGLRDDLAAMALDERLGEVERLASAGRWGLVDEAAARAAAAEDRLAVLVGRDPAAGGPGRSDAARERHAERLAALRASAPASAREALDRALEASRAGSTPAQGPTLPRSGTPGNGSPGNGSPENGNPGNGNSGNGSQGNISSGSGQGGSRSGVEPKRPPKSGMPSS